MDRHPAFLAPDEFVSEDRLLFGRRVISSQFKRQLVLVRFLCISCPEFSFVDHDEASPYSHVLLV